MLPRPATKRKHKTAHDKQNLRKPPSVYQHSGCTMCTTTAQTKVDKVKTRKHTNAFVHTSMTPLAGSLCQSTLAPHRTTSIRRLCHLTQHILVYSINNILVNALPTLSRGSWRTGCDPSGLPRVTPYHTPKHRVSVARMHPTDSA